MVLIMDVKLFYSIGDKLAQKRIERDDDMAPLDSKSKTVTIKTPSHLIELVDALASEAEMSRSAVISALIEEFIGLAFVSFNEGYLANFNNDAPMELKLQAEALAFTESHSLSLEASTLLHTKVAEFLES